MTVHPFQKKKVQRRIFCLVITMDGKYDHHPAGFKRVVMPYTVGKPSYEKITDCP